jgi:D-alanyl-D-alanine carboxypeptidase/D-alanyl-D-alanine-endopeptidase (penicillin-binding protein 4)
VLARSELHGATVGIFAERARDKVVIEQQNADLLLVPASITKVVTAAEALSFIGGQTRLSTAITAGPMQRGEIPGPLELRGGSDPTLVSADLDRMAQALYDQGLRKVDGPLTVGPAPDPAQTLGAGWAWDDATEPWSAEPSPLTVDRGYVTVRVTPSALGEPPILEQLSGDGYLALDNLALTGAPPSPPLTLVRLPGRAGTRLVGEVGLNTGPFELRVSVTDPSCFAGHVLRAALARRGITCGAVSYASWLAGSSVLVQHRSDPVDSILADALARSDNLFIETLYRLVKNPAGLLPFPSTTFHQADGCGLSRYNRFSAREMAALVQARPDVLKLLPLADSIGTLSGRLPHLRGRVRAKTGTMSAVSSLVGSIDPGTPQEIDFAILSNGFLGSASAIKLDEDQIVECLAMSEQR